jgi:hypothetical protein
MTSTILCSKEFGRRHTRGPATHRGYKGYSDQNCSIHRARPSPKFDLNVKPDTTCTPAKIEMQELGPECNVERRVR